MDNLFQAINLFYKFASLPDEPTRDGMSIDTNDDQENEEKSEEEIEEQQNNTTNQYGNISSKS